MLQRIGVVIFFLVTIVLCLTLNWMTQGYYRSQVVLGFTGVMLLGALFALALVA